MKHFSCLFFAGCGLFMLLTSCQKTPNSDCIDPNKINRDAICIEVYEPVCGCDGKTYSNSCNAANAGVLTYEKGECP